MAMAITYPDAKVSTFVVDMHTYVEAHGRTVDEKRPIIGKPHVGFVRFSARGSVKGQFEFGTATKKFDVPLPRATTVEEAFAQIADEYPPAMDMAGKELEQEIMEQLAERTGQQAIATAPANILNLEGSLRGMPSPKQRRSRRKGPLDL